MIAHVGGVPLEELVPTAAGVGGMWLLARTWVSMRVRRHRSRGTGDTSMRTG